MSFFKRLANGWKLGITSMSVIRDNPSLILFPILSGFSLILLTMSFLVGGYFMLGGSSEGIHLEGEWSNQLDFLSYMALFLFYLVNYFIVVFFNVGLVHCARKVFDGESADFGDGISFAFTRLGTILTWAFVAATVGILLKTVQEKMGAVGKIVSGILGVVWGIATFFVVPILAYEDVGPVEAVKRSASIMKDKWGESIGANFSFSVFNFLGILLIVVPSFFILSSTVGAMVAGVVAVLLASLIMIVTSSANMVFITAAYEHANEHTNKYYDSEILDDAFIAD